MAKEEAFVVMLFAEFFGGNKLENSKKLRKKVEACRIKRPKLLLDLLDSIIEKDQRGFESSMHELLKKFDKTSPKSDIANFMEVVAVVESIFYNAGIYLGLSEYSQLEPTLGAYLVTPNSVVTGVRN